MAGARSKRTPYGFAEWFTRGAKSGPLTYRTPDRGDHTPAVGVSPEFHLQVLGRYEEPRDTPAAYGLTVCECHGFTNSRTLSDSEEIA